MCLLCISIIIAIKKIIYLITRNISELEAEDAALHNIIRVQVNDSIQMFVAMKLK